MRAYFGEGQEASGDFSQDYIKANFISDAQISISGPTLDGVVLNDEYKSSGYLVLKTPSEHTVEGEHLDIEVQIHFTRNNQGTSSKAIASYLFDSAQGGNIQNNFIDEIYALQPGAEHPLPRPPSINL